MSRFTSHLARVAGALAFFALWAAPAAAGLYRRDPPRLEAGLEMAFPVFWSDDAFAELQPTMLVGLNAGVYCSRDVRVGLVVRAALTDPHAEHYEVLADVTWSWVTEPRLPEPPAFRAAASLEIGWRTSELVGSDFIVDDNGLVIAIATEIGLVAFEDVSIALRLAALGGTSSNDVFEDWAPTVRLGLRLATLF